MKLKVLRNTYSIYQFKPGSDLPSWVYSSEFYSITRSAKELSVVTAGNDLLSEDIKSDRGWKILGIEGPLEFSLVGIIAEISGILKEKHIPIFVISSYETDYILIKEENVKDGIRALEEKGHKVAIQQ